MAPHAAPLLFSPMWVAPDLGSACGSTALGLRCLAQGQRATTSCLLLPASPRGGHTVRLLCRVLLLHKGAVAPGCTSLFLTEPWLPWSWQPCTALQCCEVSAFSGVTKAEVERGHFLVSRVIWSGKNERWQLLQEQHHLKQLRNLHYSHQVHSWLGYELLYAQHRSWQQRQHLTLKYLFKP